MKQVYGVIHFGLTKDKNNIEATISDTGIYYYCGNLGYELGDFLVTKEESKRIFFEY